MKGRAIGHGEKDLAARRLLSAWQRAPELRLGQLLVNAAYPDNFFAIEDFDLIARVEAFVGELERRRATDKAGAR